MSEKLRDLARDIATEAGDLARRRRAEGVRLAATKSTLADIVTEADREVEDLIRARLAAERPGDGFLGEESGHEAGTTDVTWVVDPIDGTVNYAAGIPSYSVSIAAVQSCTAPRWGSGSSPPAVAAPSSSRRPDPCGSPSRAISLRARCWRPASVTTRARTRATSRRSSG